MLDRVCSGREPAVEIFRAIHHEVAAGACAIAARETRWAYGAGMAEDQRGKAAALLHQPAAIFSSSVKATNAR